jgi:serine/threonine protein kinase/tetratricopeptide (TPR) repeat protein
MADQEHEKRARERLGTTLKDKYRLDALIGLGGMAAVYRVSHRNRAQLALKMLHPELSMNLEIRARFLREGYAANSVQHPGVVLVTDDDVAEDGSAFLVMELLDGASVEDLWARFNHKMPASLALDIGLQLLDVLAAAHEAGIVHRDIKPANLFVTRSGTLKVLDFGIARVLDGPDSSSSSTRAGIPIGTPAFMAPEQALGRVDEVGPCTDLWAAGALLFTLLGGETVHNAPSAAETLIHAATRPARSLASIAPEVPKAVVRVVDEALAFEPKDRWPSALAMRDALAQASGLVPQAPSSSAGLASLFPPRRTSMPAPGLRSTAGAEFESAPTLTAPETAKGEPKLPDTEGPGATELPVSQSRPGTLPPAGRSKWVKGAALALLFALVAVGVFLRIRANASGPKLLAQGASSLEPTIPSAPPGPTMVVIPGSQNLTGDPLFDVTLETIVQSALRRSPAIYAYSGPAMRSLMNELGHEAAGNDEEAGRIIAQKRHGRVVLARPAVAPDGTGYRVTLLAKDVALGEIFGDLSANAKTADGVVVALARLACRLRAQLGDEPCDATHEGPLGLSHSLEADHRYSMGFGALLAGRHEDAVARLERAVAIDPNFALAHSALGVALSNLGRTPEAQDQLKLAMANREGLSLRESLELGATYHRLMDESDQARDAYEALLTHWPLDTSPRGNLSGMLLQLGQVDKSLESLRKTALEHPKLLHSRASLPTVLLIDNRVEEANQESKGVLQAFPHPLESSYVTGALAASLLGHRDEALSLLEKLESAAPSVAALSKADLAAGEGRLDDAAALLKTAIAKDERDKADAYAETKWVLLGEVLARLGDLTGAGAAATHAAKSNDIVTLLGAARILARTGKDAEATSLARLIAAHSGIRAPVFARLVAAEVLFAQHAKKEVVAEAMGEPGTGPGSWLVHADLGIGYFNLGAFEDAERELAQADAARGPGALAFYDEIPTLRYGLPVRYWLARTKDALHRTDAHDAYQAVLALAPEAKGDPLVSDAKRRLGNP